MIGNKIDLQGNAVPMLAGPQQFAGPSNQSAAPINPATSSVNRNYGPKVNAAPPALKVDKGIKPPPSNNNTVNIASDERCKDVLEWFSKVHTIRK